MQNENKPQLTIGNLWDNAIGFREFLSAALSLSAFVTALFYIGGRSFLIHFYRAMNIPIEILTLSLWDYGDVGWYFVTPAVLQVVMYSFAAVVILGVIVIVASFIYNRARKTITAHKKVSDKAESRISKAAIKSLQQVFVVGQVLFWSALILTGIAIVLATASREAGNAGAAAGHIAFLNAPQVTLITDHPLDIPGAKTTQANSNGVLYRYDGLFFLANNNDRLFMYQTISPNACAPEAVYMINASEFKQVIWGAPVDNAAQCP